MVFRNSLNIDKNRIELMWLYHLKVGDIVINLIEAMQPPPKKRREGERRITLRVVAN